MNPQDFDQVTSQESKRFFPGFLLLSSISCKDGMKASSMNAVKPENFRLSEAGDEARLMLLFIEDIKLNMPSFTERAMKVKAVLFVFAPIGVPQKSLSCANDRCTNCRHFN